MALQIILHGVAFGLGNFGGSALCLAYALKDGPAGSGCIHVGVRGKEWGRMTNVSGVYRSRAATGRRCFLI
jgi:hypothetical protein